MEIVCLRIFLALMRSHWVNAHTCKEFPLISVSNRHCCLGDAIVTEQRSDMQSTHAIKTRPNSLPEDSTFVLKVSISALNNE